MKKLIYRLFIFVLIFSPLAFGTVENWSLAVMEGTALLILCLLLARRRTDTETQWVEVPGVWPLMLSLGYILFQLVPLPLMMVRLISPSTYQIYMNTVGVFDPKAWLPLSIDPKSTISDLFRIAAYAAIYISTIQIFTDKVLLKRTIYILVGFGAIFALVSIIEHFASKHKILWGASAFRGASFGTYENRNHYAGLMEMLIPVSVSLFLLMKPVARYTAGYRERILEFFSQPGSHTVVLIGYGSILMAISVFVSLSRGGITGLCLGLGLLGALLLLTGGKSKPAGGMLCILFTVVLVSVGWFGWDPIFERFQKIRNLDGEIVEGRLLIWRDSIRIIKDFPVTGTGAGSFGAIFPAYSSFPDGGTFPHAHNDYIELATDGGIVAYLWVSWFLGAVFMQSFRTIRKRREPFSIYIFSGCAAGIFSILVHSLTDFNLHIGANGLYFFMMLGILVSAANTRFRGTHQATMLKVAHRVPGKWAAVPVSLVLLIAVTFHLGIHVGNRFAAPFVNIFFHQNISDAKQVLIPANLDKAAVFDPFDPMYPMLKAKAMMLQGGDKHAAMPFYQAAVRLAPSNALYLREWALFHAALGMDAQTADQLFRTAIQYAPTESDGYKEYGLWLINQQREAEGFSMLKKALSVAPTRTKSFIALFRENKLALSDIPRTLPDRVAPQLIYAEYLVSEGAEEMAARVFATALDQLKNEKKIYSSWFCKVSRFYRKRKQYDKALDVMRTAIHYLPKDARVRLEAAALYETLQIPFRAKEEYKQALLLDPENREAKNRMERLMNL